MKVYLDNAATTAIAGEVVESMMPYYSEMYGNPSASHAIGREVKAAIEMARRNIASTINAHPLEIYFTSGGTEASNMALMGAVRDLGVKRIITTPIEHHCVLHTVEFLQKWISIDVDYLAIDHKGNVDGVDFEFLTSVGTGEIESKAFALYQNQPNPFSTETTISFRLPEAGRAKLHIFGTDGRLIKTILGDYPAGNNAVSIQNDVFGAPGVYWYELETLQHSDRKKMILIN